MFYYVLYYYSLHCCLDDVIQEVLRPVAKPPELCLEGLLDDVEVEALHPGANL